MLCISKVDPTDVTIVLSVLLIGLFTTLLAAISWGLLLFLVIFLQLLLFRRLLLVPRRFVIIILRFGTIILFIFWNVRREVLFVGLVFLFKILLNFLLLNGFLAFKFRVMLSVLLVSFQILIALEQLPASLALAATTVVRFFFVQHQLVDIVEAFLTETACERLQDRLLLLRLFKDFIKILVGSVGGRCESPSFSFLVNSRISMIPFLDEVLSVIDVRVLSPFFFWMEILLTFSFPHQLLDICRIKV